MQDLVTVFLMLNEHDFITSLIKDYYRVVPAPAPDKIEQREFGCGNWETKIAFRHLSFKTPKELKDYLALNGPPFISYSPAYYRFPAGRPMDAKGSLGAEIIFDIDSSDLSLPCQMTHGKSWVCPECFDGVKAELIKLVEDFLVPDFGFSKSEIAVNFSGNRGYHAHVRNEAAMQLGPDARKEITAYISGTGVTPEYLFPTIGQRGQRLIGPRPTDKGWKGKIARNFIKALDGGESALLALGIDKTTVAKLVKNRPMVIMGIQQGNWDMVYIKNKADFWKYVIQNQTVAQSDRIDHNVTNDPGHLIRLPDSINGNSGLVVRKLASFNDLGKFDPMKDAIAFGKGELKIKADSKYPIVMNGKPFGPYKGVEVAVPTYAGVYLYLKGAAKIIEVL